MRKLNAKTEFVAREQEVGFLCDFIGGALVNSRAFIPSLFLLQAPSGAGKSRLVNECLGRFPEIVHLRVDLRHQQSFRGFRSEFLQAVILHYRSILKAGDDEHLSDWMWSAPRNRKSIGDAFSSLADGVTFGGATALRSLLAVVNSKTSTHIEELFAEQDQLEDWIEKIIAELGNRFRIAVTVSNAQELNPNDLRYLIHVCHKAKHFLSLEFTTESFQHGVIDRERIASLAAQVGSRVAALVLGPLKWEEAKAISQYLGDNEDWARSYYERHGFNLFDLKNLSNPESASFDSVCISDLGFGPSVLPGIRNRYPATRQKIVSLSSDQKLLLCVIYLHGGFAKADDLNEAMSVSFPGNDFGAVRDALVIQAELVTDERQGRNLRLAHDSISTAIKDCLDLLPFIKIAAKQWQTFYKSKFDRASSGTGEPAFETSIRLAYFSALIGSNDALLDACQAIYKLSKYVSIKGDVRTTFQLILDKAGADGLVPKKLRPVISYYLGASAINFQDYHLASEVLTTMDAERLGASVLNAFVCQRRDEFQASDRILAALQSDIEEHLDTEDRCLLELAGIINSTSVAQTGHEIAATKHAYRDLASRSAAFPELQPIILKHASIGYGFRESIPLLRSAIRSLEENENSFESDQAKLVLLMQLTRLGDIQAAVELLAEIRDVFPKDFAEEANLLNIEALLKCFAIDDDATKADGARELLLRARRVCRDEYRRLVVASNLFVHDHFIDPSLEGSTTARNSHDELLHLLDTSSIGFRYLYVLGYYNLMRFYERVGDESTAKEYRAKVGTIDESDSLLWRCAMGLADPLGSEVEFLVSKPYMLAFLPNYHIPPPYFGNRVDRISEIISR